MEFGIIGFIVIVVLAVGYVMSQQGKTKRGSFSVDDPDTDLITKIVETEETQKPAP
jgi:hypothetical protein